MSTLQRLADRGLIRPPRWLPGNAQYETIMGSTAYGLSQHDFGFAETRWRHFDQDRLRGRPPGEQAP